MTENKTYDNIAKWLSGNMNPAEEQLFQKWLNEDPARQDLLEEIKAIWKKATSEDEILFEKEIAWDTVAKKIDKNAGKEQAKIKQLNPFGMQLLKIAAVFILCIAVSFWVFKPSPNASPDKAFVVNKTDQPKEHTLPDGSKIWLNKNTQLSYEKSFKKRFIVLEGEAFFEVKPDKKKPFEITTSHSHTRVLGTAFNLRAYPEEDIELVVTHGKVAFYPIEKTVKKAPIILEKSEAVYYHKNTAKILEEKDTTQNALAWKTGKLEFKDRPISEILQALERNYPIKFHLEFPQVRNCPGTVDFEKETPGEIVEILEYILATEITQQDTYYLITGKACIEKMKED